MSAIGEPRPAWRIGGGRTLALDRPWLMGILNVTPDSFSDGGELASVDDAVARAMELIEQGAGIIDIGGESTRPGAAPVPPAEQIRRTVPVIDALRGQSEVAISIDTTRQAVARAALDAGADIINDTSAGQDDEDAMLLLAARVSCGLVLMHRRNAPGAERYSHEYTDAPRYGDVVADVGTYLHGRAAAAEAMGVERQAIVIDPGLGFGKSVEQNFALLAGTRELLAIGYPVLGAASRKSFIGAVTGQEDPHGRVAGSTAVSVLQYLAGVRLFRVHDVAAHRDALAVARVAATAGTRPDWPLTAGFEARE